MVFPEAQRVVYRKNPLDEVICQLRFPPILKIDTTVPSEFQERIRSQFPNFTEREDVSILMSPEMGRKVSGELLHQLIPSQHKNYEFLSEDGHWKVNLTRTFVALSVKRNYTRRSEFRRYLRIPLDALCAIYQPAYFIRVGLRYVDIIRRSVLGLENCRWDELLNSHALWMLSSPVVRDRIQTFESRCDIRLDDDSSMARIAMSLVECQEGQQEREECFMIDTDFYTSKKTPITDVEQTLDQFHVEGAGLMRWIVTNRLHTAMDPEETPNG